MVLKKVGLTGASGMLGRHIRLTLEMEGVEVCGVSRSGSNGLERWDMAKWLEIGDLDTIFADVDAVVHAGALVETGPAGNEAHIFDVNVRACANIAEWAIYRSIPVVLISSASVYAEPDAGYLSEDSPLGRNDLGGFYGMTKLMAEYTFGCYRASGLKLAILRPSSLYGFGGLKSKMPYRFIDLAACGATIDLMPNVEDRVDFVHAADLSRAVLSVLKNQCWEIFNIASGRPTSIHELALACVEVVGSGKVRLKSDEQVERTALRRFFLDSSFAYEYLGWRPIVSLREGLKMVYFKKLIMK